MPNNQSLNPELNEVTLKDGTTIPLKVTNDVDLMPAAMGQGMAVETYKYPTEEIDLPSKGIIYPKGSPLSRGIIEMKYMTAKEEDILTSQNLIQKGKAIDKFIQSLIMDKNINYEDIFLFDKDYLLLASRILAYGREYETNIVCPMCKEKKKVVVDLSSIDIINFNEDLLNVDNRYEFVLPNSKNVITYKLLTIKDDNDITREIKALKEMDKKMNKKDPEDRELSTRLKYVITSINGDTSNARIRKFVDNELLGMDSRALRKEIARITPEMDLNIDFSCESCDYVGQAKIRLGIDFFWPDAGI